MGLSPGPFKFRSLHFACDKIFISICLKGFFVFIHFFYGLNYIVKAVEINLWVLICLNFQTFKDN